MTRPKWEEPDPTLLYACAACGIEVCHDNAAEPDTEDDYSQLTFRKVPQSYHVDPVYRLTRNHSAQEVRDGVKVGEHTVCPQCAESCAECGCVLCDALSDDTYSGFASFPDPRNERHWVCIDCLAVAEDESAQEGWANASLRERIRECCAAGLSMFAARSETIPHDDYGLLQERFR